MDVRLSEVAEGYANAKQHHGSHYIFRLLRPVMPMRLYRSLGGPAATPVVIRYKQ